MKHIEQYYRNLCEQLQQQLLVLEAKIANKKKKKGKKLDPVGKEDADIDNDGEENTKTDKYLLNRRKARGKAIKGEIKEGRQIQSTDFIYGGFPRILNEMHEGDIDPNSLQDIEPHEIRVTDVDGNGDANVEDVVMRSRSGILYPSEDYARLAQTSEAAFAAARQADANVSKFHQNAAKEWGAIYDNAPAFNRALGNSGRRRAGFADRGKHMAELPYRMLRDPDMRELRASAAAAQAASDAAYAAQRTHPHHDEFMQRAQSHMHSVYGTSGNLGS